MILRRITQHVKDQNWFAVTIDFFIVVVGVFIGLQVSNWNDTQTEGKQEQEILANIIEDVKFDIAQLDTSIRMAKVNIKSGNYILSKLGLDPTTSLEIPVETTSVANVITAPVVEKLTPAQSRRLWTNLVVRYHAIRSDASFDTLMATGRLNLIRDDELVSQIQDYQQKWGDVEGSQISTYKPFRNRTIFVGQKSGLSPFIQMPEMEFLALVEQDKELIGAIRTMLEYAILHRSQLEMTQVKANALLEHLADEVERAQ